MNYLSFPGIVVITENATLIPTNAPITRGELVQTSTGMVVKPVHPTHIQILLETGAKVLKPLRQVVKFYLTPLSILIIMIVFSSCSSTRNGYGCKGNSKIMTRVR